MSWLRNWMSRWQPSPKAKKNAKKKTNFWLWVNNVLPNVLCAFCNLRYFFRQNNNWLIKGNSATKQNKKCDRRTADENVRSFSTKKRNRTTIWNNRVSDVLATLPHKAIKYIWQLQNCSRFDSQCHFDGAKFYNWTTGKEWKRKIDVIDVTLAHKMTLDLFMTNQSAHKNNIETRLRD